MGIKKIWQGRAGGLVCRRGGRALVSRGPSYLAESLAVSFYALRIGLGGTLQTIGLLTNGDMPCSQRMSV